MEEMSFEVLDRQVIVPPSGEYALVIDMTQSSFSKLPLRSISMVERVDGAWRITMSSVAFLAKNEELAAIDAAVGD
jgi:hypothetical protein